MTTGSRRAPALLAALLALAAGAGGCDDDELDCTRSGTICTWAGTGERAFDGDHRPRAQTALYWPMDLEFAPDGRGYVLDWQNHRVRRVNDDGRIETVIGTDFVGDGPPAQAGMPPADMQEAGAPGTTVELNHPTDIQFLADGTLILAAWHNHKIRRWNPTTGRVNVMCGAGPGDRGDFGLAVEALLNQPKSVAVNPVGDVFVADSRNQRIRRIDAATGMITTVAGTGRTGFEGDGGGPLEATFYMQEVNENPEPGGSIALDAAGRLYLADTFNNRIRRIDFAGGRVETVAGNGTAGFAGDGGPATAAALSRPRDVEIAPDGRLFIADTDNHRVRAVNLTTGVITTVVGNGSPGFSGDGRAAGDASLQRPFGIAFDGSGDLYVADTFNNRIRRVAH